ncbi:MAG: hypothetical protein K2K74_17820, partial [Lachnospiraceae bacterium]|nr:hypothetical protein [Lachnospiraceae bacterium]
NYFYLYYLRLFIVQNWVINLIIGVFCLLVKLILKLTAQGKSKTETSNHLNTHDIDTPSANQKKKGNANI